MKNTSLELKLIALVKPVLDDLGFHLVMLEFKGGILQILAENPATGNLGLEDCTKINKAVSPLLEVEDPIAGAYTLEISSPGIDRPLVRAEDFRNHAGFEAKVELDQPMIEGGSKKFRGRILGEKNGVVGLMVDNKEQQIELANIKKARLVLSDELIAATKKKAATNG